MSLHVISHNKDEKEHKDRINLKYNKPKTSNRAEGGIFKQQAGSSTVWVQGLGSTQIKLKVDLEI